jgi:TolA-binding protein
MQISFNSGLITIALVSFISMGCAGTAHLERQVDKLEKSLEALRKVQASQSSDLNTLQGDVQSLTGRLDELQHFQDQRIGREVSGLRDDISNLKSRVPPPAIIPATALEADEAFLATLNTDASRLVLDALVFLRDAKFREAQALLQNALEYGTKDPGYPYAIFWIGVAHDGLLDNTGALRAYNDLSTQFAKHIRTPLALLRQSDVFMRLNDRSAATITLKKLLADHPKSPEADSAKQRLSEFARR